MLYSSAHNSESLFLFLAVSQNLNNDLWSKLQGYAANKVVRVMFKGLFFLKWKKKISSMKLTLHFERWRYQHWKRKETESESCSAVSDSIIPWTVVPQASLSMEFFRQEYWSGVAIPFSRGSSWSRDRTWVSHIAGRFFTIWATGKSPLKKKILSQRVIFYTYGSSPQAHSTACSSL